MQAARSLETFMTLATGTVATLCTKYSCLKFLLYEYELLFNRTKERVAV
jgi:hypothetical protein